LYWTNELTITFKDNTVAINALEILKNRLIVGFGCDSFYKKNPSQLMHDNLNIDKNTIFLLNNIGCYTPEDAENVLPELIQHLAESLSSEKFSCEIWSNSDYTDGGIKAEYKNGLLTIKTVYYPSGYIFLECPECYALIAEMEEYENGKVNIDKDVYVCPDCGEEIEVSDWMPFTYEKTIKINAKN
jgi:hypothetical protein